MRKNYVRKKNLKELKHKDKKLNNRRCLKALL